MPQLNLSASRPRKGSSPGATQGRLPAILDLAMPTVSLITMATPA